MDNTTLFAVLISAFLVQAAALTQTWLQNREEIGIRDLAIAGVCLAFGSLFGAVGLNLLRASSSTTPVGHLIAMAGSTVAVAGWVFVWQGVRHFFGRPRVGCRAVGYIAGLFTLVVALKLVLPLPVEWRTACVSFAIAALSALTLYEFFRPQPTRKNPAVVLAIAVLLATSATWLLRGVASLDHEAFANELAFTFPLALYDGIIASVAFTLSMIVLTNERIHGRLRDQATVDPLTGIMNRRAFFEAGEPLLAGLQRNTNRLAVCLLDIDYFKNFNDTYGHTAGDAVLTRFAQLARNTLREADLVARYGGEEFAILFYGIEPQQAEQALLRLRDACAEQAFLPEAAPTRITFSAGICHASGPMRLELETLLEAADRALYEAKHSGRDRIVHAPEPFTARSLTSAEADRQQVLV